MKVLVTGGTGFLGSHLCKRLVAAGHDVTVLLRPTSRPFSLLGLKVSYTIGDITEPESIVEAVRGHDVVIHAAARAGDAATGDSARQFEVNVGGTRNVVNACRLNKVDRFLHISSVAAIGLPNDPAVPANEHSEFNLENAGLDYNLSKYQAEREVMVGVQRGVDAVIVNPAFVFGPEGSGYRGAQLIKKLGGNRLIPYFRGGICVVHVGDVVDGILLALERGERGQRYILGGENVTFRSLLDQAATGMNVRPFFVPVPRVATRLAAGILEPWSRMTGSSPRMTYAAHHWTSHYHFYDSSKARADLGFTPRGFKAIVTEYLRLGAPKRPEFARAVAERLGTVNE